MALDGPSIATPLPQKSCRLPKETTNKPIRPRGRAGRGLVRRRRKRRGHCVRVRTASGAARRNLAVNTDRAALGTRPSRPAFSAGSRRTKPLPALPPARPPKSAKRTKPQQHDTNNTRIRESGPQNQPTNTSAKAKPTNTSTKAKPPNASAKPKRGPRADKAHHHPSSHPQKWAVTNPEPHVTAPSQPLSTLEKGMDTNTARSENASI